MSNVSNNGHPHRRPIGISRASLLVSIGLLVGISLCAVHQSARADGLTTAVPTATEARGHTCAAAFLESLDSAALLLQMPGEAQKIMPEPQPERPPIPLRCTRHPWVRQLQHWIVSGMTIETAIQWRIAAPDVDTDPLITGDLADLARMQAAFTLAKAGMDDEARPLWADLTLRRPNWAEAWFNLGISGWRAGRVDALTHIKNANRVCQLHACAIPQSLLQEWLIRAGEQP